MTYSENRRWRAGMNASRQNTQISGDRHRLYFLCHGYVNVAVYRRLIPKLNRVVLIIRNTLLEVPRRIGRFGASQMSRLFKSRSARMTFLLSAMAFLFSACGGGGPADTTVIPPVATAATGTVAILLTDAPVDELSAIYLDVTEATLIGDSGQQIVFSGKKSLNLLDLANFVQPIVFGEVKAGSYSKIRLRIENLELVDKNTGVSTFPSLPANGKIDLLNRGGFAVFPGRNRHRCQQIYSYSRHR